MYNINKLNLLKEEYNKINERLSLIIDKQNFFLGEEEKYGLSDEDWNTRSNLLKERGVSGEKISNVIKEINPNFDLNGYCIFMPDVNALFDINMNLRYLIDGCGVIKELE